MDAGKTRKPRAPRKSKAVATDNATDDMNTQTVDIGDVAVTPNVSSTPEVAATPNATATSAAAAAPAEAVLNLSAGLEIKDVESVHGQLAGMLDRGAPVIVDISHVAVMDTAGVQLLLAFQSEAAKRGVSIEYSGRSTAFTHALTAVGLGDAVPHVASRD